MEGEVSDRDEDAKAAIAIFEKIISVLRALDEHGIVMKAVDKIEDDVESWERELGLRYWD